MVPDIRASTAAIPKSAIQTGNLSSTKKSSERLGKAKRTRHGIYSRSLWMDQQIKVGQRIVDIERHRWIGIVFIVVIPPGGPGDMRKVLHGVVGRDVMSQVDEGIVVDGQIPPVSNRQQDDTERQGQ